MALRGELKIEPAPEVLDGARRWVETVRGALGTDFLAAYLTGSVLTQAFDTRHSRVNVLVVARALTPEKLDALRRVLPKGGGAPHYDGLFLTRRQIEKSLDSFPIEWLELQESHLRLSGEDILNQLDVPRTYLRLQCEHELRGKHIQLRQAYLHADDAELARLLRGGASSFATLFRTLLRLRGETPPAESGRVIERVAELFGLEAQGLLVAHLARYTEAKPKASEIRPMAQRFLFELDRLVSAIDELEL